MEQSFPGPYGEANTLTGYPLNRTLLLTSLWLAGAGTLMADEAADMAGARALFGTGRFPEARRAFEGLLAADPSNPEIHYYLGRLAIERRDAAAAVRELEKAAELAPASAPIHEALGDAYGRAAEKAGVLGSYALARKCLAEYKRAVSIDPRNVEARERLLEFYYRAPAIIGGGADKAAGQAAAIESIEPGRGSRAFANLYIADGKYDLALAELDKALRTAPGDYATLYDVGRLAATSGQHLDRGLASLRLCIKMEPPKGAPPHSAAQWRLGNILEKKGDAAGARAAYRAALDLDPKYAPAAEALRALDRAHGGG
jgi:tetratricopeptide (TPR) repeat protein